VNDTALHPCQTFAETSQVAIRKNGVTKRPCDFCNQPTALDPGGDRPVLKVRNNDGPGSHTLLTTASPPTLANANAPGRSDAHSPEAVDHASAAKAALATQKQATPSPTSTVAQVL
jgi:hypothetical protein